MENKEKVENILGVTQMPDKGDLREVAGAVRKGPMWQRGKRKQDLVTSIRYPWSFDTEHMQFWILTSPSRD